MLSPMKTASITRTACEETLHYEIHGHRNQGKACPPDSILVGLGKTPGGVSGSGQALRTPGFSSIGAECDEIYRRLRGAGGQDFKHVEEQHLAAKNSFEGQGPKDDDIRAERAKSPYATSFILRRKGGTGLRMAAGCSRKGPSISFRCCWNYFDSSLADPAAHPLKLVGVL